MVVWGRRPKVIYCHEASMRPENGSGAVGGTSVRVRHILGKAHVLVLYLESELVCVAEDND
jgi:hypothetical protein